MRTLETKKNRIARWIWTIARSKLIRILKQHIFVTIYLYVTYQHKTKKRGPNDSKQEIP